MQGSASKDKNAKDVGLKIPDFWKRYLKETTISTDSSRIGGAPLGFKRDVSGENSIQVSPKKTYQSISSNKSTIIWKGNNNPYEQLKKQMSSLKDDWNDMNKEDDDVSKIGLKCLRIIRLASKSYSRQESEWAVLGEVLDKMIFCESNKFENIDKEKEIIKQLNLDFNKTFYTYRELLYRLLPLFTHLNREANRLSLIVQQLSQQQEKQKNHSETQKSEVNKYVEKDDNKSLMNFVNEKVKQYDENQIIFLQNKIYSLTLQLSSNKEYIDQLQQELKERDQEEEILKQKEKQRQSIENEEMFLQRQNAEDLVNALKEANTIKQQQQLQQQQQLLECQINQKQLQEYKNNEKTLIQIEKENKRLKASIVNARKQTEDIKIQLNIKLRECNQGDCQGGIQTLAVEKQKNLILENEVKRLEQELQSTKLLLKQPTEGAQNNLQLETNSFSSENSFILTQPQNSNNNNNNNKNEGKKKGTNKLSKNLINKQKSTPRSSILKKSCTIDYSAQNSISPSKSFHTQITRHKSEFETQYNPSHILMEAEEELKWQDKLKFGGKQMKNKINQKKKKSLSFSESIEEFKSPTESANSSQSEKFLYFIKQSRPKH